MDKDTLKQAIEEMRSEMRHRVGKKLLSIEVHAHHEEDPKDPEDPDAKDGVGGDDVLSKKQQKMGLPFFGG